MCFLQREWRVMEAEGRVTGVWGTSGHPVGYSVVLEQGSRNGGLVTESPELSVLNSS